MPDLNEKLLSKQLTANASDRIKKSFRDLAKMVADIETRKVPPNHKQETILENFATELTKGMVLCDVYGRLRTMQELETKEGEGAAVQAGLRNGIQMVADRGARRIFAEDDTNPNLVEWLDLPFEEAASFIAEREPMLAKGWEEAAQAYHRHGFALARNSAIELAKELQNRMQLAIIEGRNPLKEAKDAQWLSKDFDRQYMNVVATTNFAGAYVAGRERQMRSPGVQRHVAAHIFKSALLPTTRPNHRACHNFLAAPEDPLWNYLSPLLGYQCYCRKRPVFKAEIHKYNVPLTSEGVVMPAKRPPGAEPDSQYFGRRPDTKYYGG